MYTVRFYQNRFGPNTKCVPDLQAQHSLVYPFEIFRVRQKNEIRQFGEYRTRRLVLDAWGRLESAR